MNALKDTLRSYQKNLDRGEFYYNQDDHKNALKYYNQAIGELYNAKEQCQYSNELQDLKEKDQQIKSWLHKKLQSIKSQLAALTKYTKELQHSVNYAVTLNKTTKVVTEPKEQIIAETQLPRNRDTPRRSRGSSYRHKRRESRTRKSRDSHKSRGSSRTGKSRRESHSEESDESNDHNVKDVRKKDTRKNYRDEPLVSGNDSDNWKDLANRAIKLLCHLRSVYDFEQTKDKEFEDIFRHRSELSRNV